MMKNTPDDWKTTLYERLAEDDEGRVCKDISDEACRETPGNFLATLIANTASSVADRLASAKTTLPWLLLQVGAPSWIISLLVPIRESGSMLPQMLIGAWVRGQAVRKWIWVGGGAVQGLALLLMVWCAFALEGLRAGLAVVALLVMFSLARGACSVAYKDVLGKTIPKTRRGRLSGWISAIAGLAAFAAGLLLSMTGGSEAAGSYAILLAAGAGLWLLAIISYARIREFPGATDGGANGFAEAFARLSLLRDDKAFRQFVIARALAMGSGLVAPFYIALAQDDLGSAASLLGIFIAVEGLAGLLSSPVWGRWADRSSRQVFAVACALASVTSLAVAAWAILADSAAASQWFYPLAFFILGVSHAGVRLGRKTYLVDMAGGNKRTDYVAVSNTVIGLLLLVSGVLGALAALVSVPLVIALLGAAGLLGAGLSWRWQEVSG
ncbi:MFS transporter [Pseudohongiella sp.]|uniref:Major facilitator superfamily (MFS) profile domain-containing protein n=1 Tax=marine sediment metagenome TaxID=412755 RepID=A0A0F9VPE8_9ZZZZ|nr:MFS transporter [Pseudohongiella sp.]HDZ10202.1 MFS transporter [Pseudohongiella sp.]HEA64266.1 MFS transporter [Pseudohongiella sp.]